MLKRTCGMVLRFTKAEMDALTKKARKANMSREGFCRRVLNEAEVKEAPPVDVPILIREVRRVGYNIDQLLKIANAQGLVDVPQLRKALEENRALVKQITKVYAMTED